MSLKVKHDAGFFSCCSVKLLKIIKYFYSNKKLPDSVDSSSIFRFYKKNQDEDVTYDFFERDELIDIDKGVDLTVNDPEQRFYNFQFVEYSKIEFDKILPLVQKYFTPSAKIFQNTEHLIKKYNINPEEYIGLYYRGTDKHIETTLGEYETYENILTKLPKSKILLVTDDAKCRDYFKKRFSNITVISENKSSYSNLGIHNENTALTNYYEMFDLFASFLILSKCKYLITSSGNCSLWMVLYRGHANKICQYLNGNWFTSVTL